MNKQKNKLKIALSSFTLLFLAMITTSATANAFLLDWLGITDIFTTIMIIVIAVAVIAVIGFIIYIKFFTPAGMMSNIKK